MDWALKTPVTNQKKRPGPKPTEEENEILYSDVNANDLEDHGDNLLEGTMVLLQSLEGT